jgi:conjugal transfer/entry exclusion protein
MSTYTEAADKIQSQILDGIKQLQATNLEMVANFSKSAGALAPKTPEVPVGFDPKQLLEGSFKFTNQILELQKDYLIRLTETLKPLAKTAGATGAAEKA